MEKLLKDADQRAEYFAIQSDEYKYDRDVLVVISLVELAIIIVLIL